MTRMVMCRKYKQELEGLDKPPLPGPKGQQIFETISKRAWTEWTEQQTMLINEKRLSLIDPQARKYLAEQMERFFDNLPIEQASGYVPKKT